MVFCQATWHAWSVPGQRLVNAAAAAAARPCVCRRAEATDIANAVLDGVDGILLGAETYRGNYALETVNTGELRPAGASLGAEHRPGRKPARMAWPDCARSSKLYIGAPRAVVPLTVFP